MEKITSNQTSKIAVGLVVGLIVVVVLLPKLLGSGDSQTEKSDSETKRQLPAIQVQTFNGDTQSLSDFVGTPLLVNSWATWCSFCREELNDFAIAQAEYGDRLKIIAVNRAEPLSQNKEYTDEVGVTDKLVFLLDKNDDFYKEIGGVGMPITVFVDETGTIVTQRSGPMKLAEMRERIQQAFGIN